MDFMTYRGYPLVRKENDLYFGYMSDPFVVMLRAFLWRRRCGSIRCLRMRASTRSKPLSKAASVTACMRHSMSH